MRIHQASDLGEPQLAGDWRGVFGHKNMASAVFSVLVFVGLFVKDSRPLQGWLIFALSLFFVIASGGKSSAAICLATIANSALATRLSSTTLWTLLVGAALLLLNLFGVGSAVFPQIASMLAALPVDASFTGRSEIWSYALPKAMEAPLFGHGFLGFWGTGATRFGGEQNSDWAGGVAHAHNGYLDAVLSMGLPGLALFLAAFVLEPARNIRRALSRTAVEAAVRAHLDVQPLSRRPGEFLF